jgi:hypothetical protein
MQHHREAAVAVNVGMETAELAEQGTFRLGVSRVKFPLLGIEQIVKEQGYAFIASPT